MIESDLKYLGKIGNVFHTKNIEAAIEKGAMYDPQQAAANSFLYILPIKWNDSRFWILD